MTGWQVGIDIGGTFTDLALEHGGGRRTAKVLTTGAEPERGVLEGVAAILRGAGLTPADVGILVHGTTLATNAIIERKGARPRRSTRISMGHAEAREKFARDSARPRERNKAERIQAVRSRSKPGSAALA